MVQTRQITEPEKAAVLERQGMRCFIDDHPIESTDDVEFDHVHAFSEGGATAIDNIAAVCKRHTERSGISRSTSIGTGLRSGGFSKALGSSVSMIS